MIEPNPNIDLNSGLEVISAKKLFNETNDFHQNKIPSLTKLKNGKLLLSFVINNNEKSVESSVALTESHDNGNNWSNPRILYEEPGWSCLNMGGLVRFSDEFIRLMIGKIKIDFSLPGDEPFSECVTGYIDSYDGGKSWSNEFNEINLFPAWTELYGQSNPHLLKDGRYLMATMGTLGRDVQWHAGVSFCDPKDNYNLSQPVIIANHPERHYSDIDVVRLEDGRLLAVIREHNLLKTVYSHSKDEGQTWIPISYTGFCGSNIKLQKLNSGNIACLYRDEDPDNRGISVSVSKDGGENWNYHGQLYSAPKDAKHLPYYKCGYPDLTYLNKTDILGVLHTYPDEKYCMEIHQITIRDHTLN